MDEPVFRQELLKGYVQAAGGHGGPVIIGVVFDQRRAKWTLAILGARMKIWHTNLEPLYRAAAMTVNQVNHQETDR